MNVLSFVVPAYNEEATLKELIEKVEKLKLPKGWDREIIIVNDCSKDSTGAIADTLHKRNNQILSIHNAKNLGKTQSVRKGILASKGDYVVVQDADLEYEPEDIVLMLEQLLRHKADVAYGNRFGVDNGMIYVQNFYGNIFLSFVSSIFTSYRLRVVIPDMEVCYKLIQGDIAREIADGIVSKTNFGFEPEITAKLSRYTKADGSHLKFVVLPVHYYPRTIAEGKKMKAFQDGIKALGEILRFNLF